MIGVILAFKFICLAITCILIFVEWNVKETLYDVRFLSICIYTYILLLIVYTVINKIGINKYARYTTLFILHTIIYISVGVTNYICLYGYRIIYECMTKNRKIVFINNVDKKFMDDETRMSAISQTYDQSVNYKESCINDDGVDESNTVISSAITDSNVVKKLISYHYRESISNFHGSKGMIPLNNNNNNNNGNI